MARGRVHLPTAARMDGEFVSLWMLVRNGNLVGAVWAASSAEAEQKFRPGTIAVRRWLRQEVPFGT